MAFAGSEFPTGGTGGKQWIQKMSESAPFIINKYMSRVRFEGIFLLLRYTDINDVEYTDELFHMRQME